MGICSASYSQSIERDHFGGIILVNDQLVMGDTMADVVAAVGAPEAIVKEDWEMDESIATGYVYPNGDQFWFVGGALRSFTLISSDFFVRLESLKLQVGGDVDLIRNQFPKSFANRASGGTTINLGEGDHAFLLLEFNSAGVITKIDWRTF